MDWVLPCRTLGGGGGGGGIGWCLICQLQFKKCPCSPLPESLALAVADEKLGTRRLLWSTLGNGTAVWSHATVALGERGRPFQVSGVLRALEFSPRPFITCVCLLHPSEDLAEAVIDYCN